MTPAKGPTDRRAGGEVPTRLVQDSTIAELTLLDVLDLDLEGRLRLNEAFVEEVRREHRAEQSHRKTLGYQSDERLGPALRSAVRTRARTRGQTDVDVEPLVYRLQRMLPEIWET